MHEECLGLQMVDLKEKLYYNQKINDINKVNRVLSEAFEFYYKSNEDLANF